VPSPPTAGPAFGPFHCTRAEAVLRKSHILVVDDEEYFRSALERILSRVGHHVHGARNATEALEQVAAEPIELVLVDVQMPGINGLELVRQIHDIAPELPCIVMTGHGGLKMSTEALEAGAFWYLDKASDMAKMAPIRRLVESAIELGQLKSENRRLQTELRRKYRFENIVGSSRALRSVLDVVGKVADTHSTVLVTGESGTGKELIARALHYNSSRSERGFVTVNCGAIPGELLESELFGHVKGAFTNAVNHREGRFSLANGGTIFLDEIGDMSANLQVKLLRVLQDGTFEPVGSSKTLAVDTRVVAATNQDLEEAIREKRFREDLFYRLNVIPIEVPPLRRRHEDIPQLVHHFLEIANEDKGRQSAGISAEALELLCAYAWPGNVRELENLVERLVVLGSGGEIIAEDLPAPFHAAVALEATAPRLPVTGLSFRDAVDGFETDLILQALEQTQWNKNRAAQLLGLNRTTLLEKIKKKGLGHH
jgi:DNA-binding NtrC family response regulator